MKITEQIATKYWKRYPNINKYQLKMDIARAIKKCIDEVLDDPKMDMMFRPDGYYRVIKPNKEEFKLFKRLKPHLPDRWVIIVPNAKGDLAKETYYSDGSLKESYMKLPALRSRADLELVS